MADAEQENETEQPEPNLEAVPFEDLPVEQEAEDAVANVDPEVEPNIATMDMAAVLHNWDSKYQTSNFDPVPTLKRLAEIFESEADIYMRKDPDPFDERHPYRSDPACNFGFLLKSLFRKEVFMNRLVNDYLRENYFTRQNMQRNSLELNILACRLILTIMPGLETSAVFQVEYDHLINRIYSWAEDSIEPLQSYATGLLAAAMEVTDIAITFRELNTRLVPKMLKRLQMLQAMYKSYTEDKSQPSSVNNSFDEGAASLDHVLPSWMTNSAPHSPQRFDDSKLNSSNVDTCTTNSNMSFLMENSRDALPNGNACYYKKMYIPIHPATAETSQMLILRYLTSMGEYQEFLGSVFENNAMQIIFGYIQNLNRRDTCLAFEALKYLASLLCHKKFALEFIANGGLELLLKVPRPSIAATGVSIALYYLAYSEDSMERICTMPRSIIKDLVHYALWLLGRSYDSGKCHATMFFGLSFQFKVILNEFDAQDGLRKLYNVISILKILNPSSNEEEMANDDIECASRQLVRHVCVAMKRYLESHLFFKYNHFMHQQSPNSAEFANLTRSAKQNLEQISEQINTLQENTSVRAHWAPVDHLLKLGGVTLLLKIIAFSYEWTSGGRSETVRSALDVLSVCCVIPRVFTAFCEGFEMPDGENSSGIHTILGTAAGDISTDPDVQKSALALLCHCVCAPLARKDSMMKCFSASKRTKATNKYYEEIIEKVWESVCSNNGIIVLLSLMQTKVPITDADCIRGMSCRALAGLARSQRVRQIVSKLPLFASGQIQTLMRDPILQEKRTEHVIFQKYALELMELVFGKTKPARMYNQFNPAWSNIHKANVIAQTKIQYNEQQLLQLIYEHLESKGMIQSAQMLQKEAGLQLPSTTTRNFHQSPFDYKVAPMSLITRSRLRTRTQEFNTLLNAAIEPSSSATPITPNGLIHDDGNINGVTPIKLVKKSERNNSLSLNSTTSSIATTGPSQSMQQRSLQKQISLSVDPDSLDDSNQNYNNKITLSTIVTEYLTNQHSLCNNPMTTCPQFDLFIPHKCPDFKSHRVLNSNLNLTTRLFRSQAGYNSSRYDRHFVHSNFAPWRVIRATDFSETQFSNVAILSSSNLLLVSTHQGEVKGFNFNDGSERFSSKCHSYPLESMNVNRRGNLVLTSVSWQTPLTGLWSIEPSGLVNKYNFTDDFYCEFSNLAEDRAIGTQNDCSVLYDINTGAAISTYKPTISNQYTKNRATLSPRDELLLSDGVLWDVRSCKQIHKFDKLNQALSGVFHPNGLEIISNTEVWDLRTFHLLQTVPSLDQCFIKFSPMKVLYGISFDTEQNDFNDTPTYETSFKVLDAYDYSSIATIDVKRHIYDLSVSGNGSLIGLVENHTPYDSKQETVVKIYAVGMKKNDQQEEEEDEEEQDDPDSDEDDTGSDATDLIFDVGNDYIAARRTSRNANNDDGEIGIDGNSENGNNDNNLYSDDDTSSGDNDSDSTDSEEGWISIGESSDSDASSVGMFFFGRRRRNRRNNRRNENI